MFTGLVLQLCMCCASSCGSPPLLPAHVGLLPAEMLCIAPVCLYLLVAAAGWGCSAGTHWAWLGRDHCDDFGSFLLSPWKSHLFWKNSKLLPLPCLGFEAVRAACSETLHGMWCEQGGCGLTFCSQRGSKRESVGVRSKAESCCSLTALKTG